jgi:steroid delta-isomerase-like uncharacterized protein
MTHDEIRAFLQQHVEKFSRHDPSALAADHAPDGVVDSPRAGRQQGREAIEAVYRSWFAAFPDLTATAEEILVDGDRAAVFCRIRATHHGEFLGLEGSGKQVEFPLVYFQTLAERHIIHERRIYDFSGVLIRLGVLKVKPA